MREYIINTYKKISIFKLYYLYFIGNKLKYLRALNRKTMFIFTFLVNVYNI